MSSKQDFIQLAPKTPQDNQKGSINNNLQQVILDDATKTSAQPLLAQNGEMKLTFIQRKCLIQNINRLWVLQKLFQVALSFISGFLMGYDNLFYDYEEGHFRISYLILVFLMFCLFVTVRFVPAVRKIRISQFIIYWMYLFLYSLSMSSLLSLGYENADEAPWGLFLFGIFTALGSIGELFILIQYHFQIQTYKEDEFRLTIFLKSIFKGTLALICVVIIILGMIGFSVLIFFEAVWVIFFTILYIFSLLQVFNGKFELSLNEQYIGSVLVFINMFLPCI